MAESVFRGALGFLEEIGIYDVVLPFLLVFTIVFAILEKTKIFGVERVEGVDYTKKNLNAVVAFVVGFFVIASTKLVAAINESLANVVLLLIVSISFLLLIGSFYHHEEKVFLEKGWRTFFMVLMFIGVVLIFMHAIKTDSGSNWLDASWNFLKGNWATDYTASIIFLVLVILLILFVVRDKKPPEKKAE